MGAARYSILAATFGFREFRVIVACKAGAVPVTTSPSTFLTTCFSSKSGLTSDRSLRRMTVSFTESTKMLDRVSRAMKSRR